MRRAKQSIARRAKGGLLRRFAPRNDEERPLQGRPMSLVRYESKDHVATITMDRALQRTTRSTTRCATSCARPGCAFATATIASRCWPPARRRYFCVGADVSDFPVQHVARRAGPRRRARQAGDRRDLRLGGRRRRRVRADGRPLRGLRDHALQLSRGEDRHHRRRHLLDRVAHAAQDRDGVSAGRRGAVGRARLPDRLRQPDRAEGPASWCRRRRWRRRSPATRRWWCRA